MTKRYKEKVETFNVRLSQSKTKTKVATQYIRGPKGASTYEVALDNGFIGTEEEWLESLNGLSAYEVALDEGFVGSREEWLESLKDKSLIVSLEDKDKILTNDGEGKYWVTIEEKLNSTQIEWDLGEI